MSAIGIEGRTRDALSRAARWRLLSLLIERPRPGWVEETRKLASELRDDELTALATEAATWREGDYLAVFGPGGAVSPREVSYRPMADPGQMLAELAGFYDAFAYRPQLAEPADHAAVEIGFLSYLHLKEAFALADCRGREHCVALEAIRRFTDEHLSGFLDGLAARLAAAQANELGRAVRCAARTAGLHGAALWVVQPPAMAEESEELTCWRS